MFVSNQAIPLSLDNENFIWVKPKLNFGAMRRVRAAMLKSKLITGPDGKDTADVDVNFPAYQSQLLVESIVSWNGPVFEGRPYTPEALDETDPDDPLIQHVLTEVSKRNQQGKKDTDPKGSVSDGEALLLDASEIKPSVTGTST
jgi:hypothetical protein